VSLPALGSAIDPNISLAGAQSATGNTPEDLTIVPAIVPTDSHHPDGDVRQENSTPVRGKGFSSVVEMAFTGKSGDGNVGSLNALTSRDASPAFQNLNYNFSETQPTTKPSPVFSSASAWESHFPVPLEARYWSVTQSSEEMWDILQKSAQGVTPMVWPTAAIIQIS
jgi:hypothetical protein